MPYRNEVNSRFFNEVEGELGRYFIKETPLATYTFSYMTDWDGNEKKEGQVFFRSENDEGTLFEGTIDKAEDAVMRHMDLLLEESKKEEKQEEAIESLEDQLRSFARVFRSAQSPEDVQDKYRYILQQANDLGMIDRPLRMKINKLNRTIGSRLDPESFKKELQVMAQVMDLLADVARKSKTASVEGESYMSVQALQSMRDHSAELLTRVQANTPLPDWAESKLTQAAQSLNDVYEYLTHGLGKTSSMDRKIQEEIKHMDHLNRYMYNGHGLEGLDVDEAGEIAFDLKVSLDQVMEVAKRMGLKTPVKTWF